MTAFLTEGFKNKFFFKKIVCLLFLSVSVACSFQNPAQSDIDFTDEQNLQPEVIFSDEQNLQPEAVFTDEQTLPVVPVTEQSPQIEITPEQSLQLETPVANLDQAERAIYRVDIEIGFDGNDILLKSGTGFFISEDLFVTNFHVVDGAINVDSITLYPTNGDESSPIKIKNIEYVSVYSDLAILRTETKSPYFLKQREIPLNEKLTLIGYPQGQFQRWESAGFAVSSPQPYDPSYKVQLIKEEDLASNGASGSPLLNSKGEYVGVISKVSTTGTEEFSFFIPAKFIDKLLKEETGRKCTDFSCIKEESQMLQNHMARYAHNKEEIPLDDEETFFHFPVDFLISVSDRDTVLSYLIKGTAQEKDLYQPFINGLDYFKSVQSIDSDMYLDLLTQAGEQGNIEAQKNLYSIYKEGIGVEKDDKQVFYWAKKAAEQGDVNAQKTIGIYYYCGMGVEVNLMKSYYWFNQVVDQNSDQRFKAEALQALKVVERALENYRLYQGCQVYDGGIQMSVGGN